MSELKPCPFCGGEAKLTLGGNVHSSRKCVVKCGGCRYQRTDAALRHGDDWLRATAIAAWNTRAPTAEHEALLKRVAEADRLRGLLSDTVAVAITMLYDTHKGDVLATFSKDELAQVVGSTRHLNESNARVESVYRRAWDAVRILAEPGEVGCG